MGYGYSPVWAARESQRRTMRSWIGMTAGHTNLAAGRSNCTNEASVAVEGPVYGTRSQARPSAHSTLEPM